MILLSRSLVLILFLTTATRAFAADPGQQVITNVHKCIDHVSSCTNEGQVKSAWSQAMTEAETVTESFYRFLYDIFAGTNLPTPPAVPPTGPIKQATTPNKLVTPTPVTPVESGQ